MRHKHHMPYKQNCKELGEVKAKLFVIKDIVLHGYSHKDAQFMHSCSKNTVTTIMYQFKERATENHKQLLQNNHSISQSMVDQFSFLKYSSRAPKTNPNTASKDQEDSVLALFNEKRGWGAKRVHNALKHRMDISFGLVKGVFKRNNLRRKKVRTSNGSVRSIYDMHELRVFEKMQVDLKHIADKKALPKESYEFYKNRKDIPKYQITFFFPKARIKLHLYCFKYSSDYSLRAILYALKYLRSCGISYPIDVIKDGGPEFTSNSTRKENVWNYQLSKLNARTYVCEKRENNFIERSHRTDDDESYVPQTHRIHSREDFLNEADRYIQHFNHQRKHQGIQNQTPAQVAYDEGVYNIKRIVTNFKPFIIEDHYHALSNLLNDELDISEIRDDSGRYVFEKHCSKRQLNQSQNVLYFYLCEGKNT